jgi:hypothetical protein
MELSKEYVKRVASVVDKHCSNFIVTVEIVPGPAKTLLDVGSLILKDSQIVGCGFVESAEQFAIVSRVSAVSFELRIHVSGRFLDWILI